MGLSVPLPRLQRSVKVTELFLKKAWPIALYALFGLVIYLVNDKSSLGIAFFFFFFSSDQQKAGNKALVLLLVATVLVGLDVALFFVGSITDDVIYQCKSL